MNEVKFNLKSRKNKTSLINLIYRYDNRKLKMSTGIIININHWNDTKQRVREIAGYFEYSGYNAKLQRYETATKSAYSYFENRNQIPSIIELRNKVKLTLSGGLNNSEAQINTIVSYIDNYVQEAFNAQKNNGTIQGFIQLNKVLKTFNNGTSLEFKDLSESIMDALTIHMVNEWNYSSSQINKIQRKLTTIVNKAKTSYDVNPEFSLRKRKWKITLNMDNKSGKAIAFTPIELKSISEVSLEPRLDKVRDRFFIGINTGQRYSDFYNLNESNIIEQNGTKYWDFIQKKTNKRLILEVNENCLEILNKYSGEPPVISIDKFNKYLKEVCKLANINEEIIIRKQDPIHGVTNELKKQKWEVVSSHDCRRTLATLLYKKGVSLIDIKRITGHKQLKDLETYIQIDNMEPIIQLTNLY